MNKTTTKLPSAVINAAVVLKDAGFDAYLTDDSARDFISANSRQTYYLETTASKEELLENKDLDVRVATKAPGHYLICGAFVRPMYKWILKNGRSLQEHTTNIEEAARAKGIRINSFFVEALTGVILDPLDVLPMKELEYGLIRLEDPEEALLNDKTLLLKCHRLAATLKNKAGMPYAVDWEKTGAAIKKHATRAMLISVNDLNRELYKLMSRADEPSIAFRGWDECGVLNVFFPELKLAHGIAQSNKGGNLDLFRHIMLCIDAAPKTNLELRFAALLHDIAKPWVMTNTDGVIHFYGHEWAGAYQADKILKRWGFKEPLVSRVANLTRYHLFDTSPNMTDAAIRRLIKRVGQNNIMALLDLREIDRLGTGRPNISMKKVSLLRRRIERELNKNEEIRIR